MNLDLTSEDIEWIVCFALIQHRNKKIWKLVTNKLEKRKDFPVDVCEVIPSKLNKVMLNKREHFDQLKPIYMFNRNAHFETLTKHLFDKPQIFSTFSDDISKVNMTKWYYPRYKLLLLELFEKNSNNIKIDTKLYHLFQCFQELTISFCCFQLDSDFLFLRNFLCKTLLYRTIFKDILSLYLNYLTNDQGSDDEKKKANAIRNKRANTSLIWTMKLHLKTVVNIFNFQIHNASPPRKEAVVIQLIEKYLLLIGNLFHVLINLLDRSLLKYHNTKTAYVKLYQRKKNILPHYYWDDFKNILQTYSQFEDIKEEGTDFLKCTLRELIELVGGINWRKLKEKGKCEGTKFREIKVAIQFIQAELLLLRDSNLIALFYSNTRDIFN
ncbi:Mei4p NDAI_0G01930 [Naumovozyma dairenensis CBS 421]|uniref:Uncharacterized protein n=1 Tax=Naumovozyma dairenensis (strain ATCC 10597 / BCRC 20456 / CBS 421 / NBRC 0211 / NRRL Y-12639) TaxID=1071378 RepID=G0WDV7_NAUDC|nr:hypothetical protein NDAI_0G01930 [Naumovozyma dairenensis CBS 421]CCD25968.2 hypothetical protein NDAI_0G01930 [Naumovozyma dairenensis CBS 421]